MTTNFDAPIDPATADAWVRHADAVADATRRDVLSALDATPSEDDVIPVSDLFALANPALSDHARIALHHLHLPKLSASGLVRWDRERGTVARGTSFGQIVPLLRSLHEFERRGSGSGSGPGRGLSGA